MGVDCLFGLAWWQQDKQQQQTAMAMARVNGFAQETDGRQTLPVGSLQIEQPLLRTPFSWQWRRLGDRRFV